MSRIIFVVVICWIAGCRSDVAQQDAIALARSKGADVRISISGDAVRIDLRHCRMDPELRTALHALQAVESFLASEDFSDADIDAIDSFPGLKTLDLSHSTVGSMTFEHLAQLRQLEFLSVNGLTLSDADMKAVSRLRQLKSISLVDANISDAALRHFREANPECMVAH